jgi:ATP-dependent Clp protease adaptor protein ClpS
LTPGSAIAAERISPETVSTDAGSNTRAGLNCEPCMLAFLNMSAEPLCAEVAMDKGEAITTFPIWKNAGPSTVDKPTIEKETRSEEDLDLPWQVVVHNDPVNLMSYVTMVFQRVFGYPREKAERHMLEVHHNGRSILWSGMRERAELYVQQLHGYLLLATLEKAG